METHRTELAERIRRASAARRVVPIVILALVGLPSIRATAQAQSARRATPTAAGGQRKKRGSHPKTQTGLSASEQAFMRDAALGGMAEVELGRLAQKKGLNADVKKFGALMVHDHRRINGKLRELARREHVALPTELGPNDRNTRRRLQKLEGAAFDKQYIDLMVRDHRKDVADFEGEGKKAVTAALRGWIEQTTPILRHHLALAERAQQNLKRKASHR